MSKLTYALFSLCLSTSVLAQQDLFPAMSIERMDRIFREEAKEVDRDHGLWQLFYGNRILFVLTDEVQNRMRIFTPIGAEANLEAGQEKTMLEANFHSALDAKYSLYNGFVVSIYTHPLRELTKEQLRDAMAQVVLLADNFGGTYASTNLIFDFEDGEFDKEVPERRINQKPQKN